ncbi:MAG TPA: trypsin-like peptidase domain-containing protein [Syntrophobacteria bacterium]|nr:trypsin-like peptidase domain-containing protein [Syntrophobacteria bacterium]
MRSRLLCFLALVGVFGAGGAVHAESLHKVFQKISPAVVVIETKEQGIGKGTKGEVATERGLASGVVISREGLIMTAAHVVQVADQVTVYFLDGREVAAGVVSASVTADVALLKIDPVPENLTVAELGDSDSVSPGDQVFVVGAPYGVSHTLTVGYLSGRRKPREVCDQLQPIEFLQTDAAINRGNSGGPLCSLDGKVVGIVSHILTQSGGSEGVGFAASINTAKELLLKKKSFWTGLDFYFLSGDLARAFNVPQDAALLIQRVADASPGYAMGLQPGKIPVRIGREEFLIGGDIIMAIQNIPISMDTDKSCDLRQTLLDLPPGGRIEVKVLRDGKILNLMTTK